MSDEEILASFAGKFDSAEINDADEFEKNAKKFEPWFKNLKYQFIQPNFDELWKMVIAIAMHYRPQNQAIGCNALYILIKEAAPAQIRRVGAKLRKSLDKLVQIGHPEVLPDLVRVITKAVPLIYEDASGDEFNQFFTHYLESWGRDKTSDMAAFVFATEFNRLMPFIGICAARYLCTSLAIIEKRIKFLTSRNHIRQFIAALESLCSQTWPVVTSNAADVERITAAALEKCDGDDLLTKLAANIRTIINTPAAPPVFTP